MSHWDDATEYVPGVIVAIGIPFSFSIATGIGLGFVVYVVVKAGGRTRRREIPGAVWLIAALSVLKFALAGVKGFAVLNPSYSDYRHRSLQHLSRLRDVHALT